MPEVADEALHGEEPLAIDRADLLDPHRKIGERLLQIAPPSPQAIMAVVRRFERPALRVYDLEFRSPECLSEFSALNCLCPAPDCLHVLLRHRLLRQPHGFEGSGFLPERLPPDDPAIT